MPTSRPGSVCSASPWNRARYLNIHNKTNTVAPIQQWRADTPACESVIHLNSAGSALPPSVVTEAMCTYLTEEAALGGYELAARRAQELADFYPAVAQLLGAEPHQIAFASSATDAYNKALSSIRFEAGDVILTTPDDYSSNQIAFLQLQQQQGVQVVRAARMASGGVDPDDMRRLMQLHRPKLVAVTYVPTNSGLVQEVEAIGRYCREFGLYYLVDACQAAGQMPLDVHALGCDFLSATFRKFLRGPRGAGFLYVSQRVLDSDMAPLHLDMQSANWSQADGFELMPDARRFELWERNYALVLGAAVATRYALHIGLEVIAERTFALAQYARQQLGQLPSGRVLDEGANCCGIVTAHFPQVQPQWLLAELRARRIHTSISTRHAALIDFDHKGVDWALRISPHYYNTEAEIDACVAALRQLL